MMYIENLNNPLIVAAIPVICAAFVQIVKPAVTKNRMFWLPFTSVVLGILLTYFVLVTPPNLAIALFVFLSGLLPSAAHSATKEFIVKKETTKETPTDLGNPPDHL